MLHPTDDDDDDDDDRHDEDKTTHKSFVWWKFVFIWMDTSTYMI